MTETTEKACNNVVGRTAFEIVARSFQSANDDERRRYFRIKNLSDDEVEAFLDAWQELSGERGLEGVRVVVASDASSSFRSEYRADPNCSITYYRNNNEAGLVYLETKVETDQQGLKNLFTLRDSNFLDRSFDEDGFAVARTIIQCAWEEQGGQPADFPELMATRIEEVLNHLHPMPLTLSVRKFTRFVIGACRARRDHGTNMGTDDTDRVVGEQLAALDLFPDPLWRAGGTEGRVARRLTVNASHAELANPSGGDLDADQVAELASTFVFRDADDAELPDDEQKAWRKKCSGYCEFQEHARRSAIPYPIFSQLFQRDVKGLALGDRVEGDIADRSSARLPELKALKVIGGLNSRLAEAAQNFLEQEAKQEEDPPLRDLLSKQTRRMVERLAYPSAERFSNPLTKLAEIVVALRERNPESDKLKLVMSPGSAAQDKSELTLGLFAFLYAPTLRAVAEDSATDATGIELVVDDGLLQFKPPPELKTDSDDQEDDAGEELEWTPVAIEFRLLSSETGKEIDSETGYEWLPEFPERQSLLWLLACAPDAPDSTDICSLPEEQDVGEWCDQISRREISLRSACRASLDKAVLEDSRIANLVVARSELRDELREGGLQQQALEKLFDRWEEILSEAKADFIPDGHSDPRISALFALDVLHIDGASSTSMMLPIHPFRLRWLARYLRKSEELAVKALGGDLRLNPQNDRLYLDWIAGLSPHQQPPVFCGTERELLFSAGELGWTEQYVGLGSLSRDGNAASADASSISEIANQVSSYLEAHPYKSDGLRLLVVLQQAGDLPAAVAQAVRKSQWKDVPLQVHVLAPQSLTEQIVSSFERIPSESRMSARRPLFPPLQLELHRWEDDSSFSEILGDLNVDIAIVPQVLNDNMKIQHNTEPDIGRDGTFDPLLDQPSFVYGGNKGGAISVSMRPASPDPSLEAWSTLAVRQHRARPVAPQQPENIDFVELQINFEDTARLFDDLHGRAHWVVTLERHIRREQIESLEASPDILTVKEGVGANSLYTLIVSSNSGAAFVVARLERKLTRLLRDSGDEGVVAQSLARGIYDETRRLAPRLALQAMGLSRVTEEILGLMVARSLAEQIYPVSPTDGAVVWISLDEHPEWFRGNSGTRADLLRMTFEFVDDELLVDALVLEGKLRQAYDPHGVDQVKSTMLLLKGILPSAEDEADRVDAPLWREQLLLAIENLNADPLVRRLYGRLDDVEEDGHWLPNRLRDKFRAGQFNTRNLDGLFSICFHGQDGEEQKTEEGDVVVVRSYRNQLLDLVREPTRPLTITDVPTDSPPEPENTTGDAPEDTRSSTVTPGPDDTTDTSGDTTSADGHPLGKLTEGQLSERYQHILDRLGEFGVEVRVPDDPQLRFVEGPASVMYRVLPGSGVEPRRINERADALKLSLALTEDQRIRFSIDSGFVTIDVPKNQEERYFVSGEYLWRQWERPEHGLVVPIGVDRFGEPVTLDFSSANSPHLLIGGTTGSGKSEALNTILVGLVKHYDPKELRLMLVDPKGTELQQFTDSPHLEGDIGWDEADASALLTRAVDEMQDRYRKFKEVRTRSLREYNEAVDPKDRLPWGLIVLDEYADLTSDPDAKKQIEAALKRLAQKARAAGLHVVIATQKPSAEVISTNLRSNLPAQLALRVRSATESRVIMEEGGAETLNGMGDAFLKSEGRLTRVQCAKVSNST